MASRTYLLLGQCLPCLKQNASKILVRRMELDKNINMYFKKEETYFVHDPSKKCKTGDVVLIKELPQKLTNLITHSIEEFVFLLGDVKDPVTNKQVTVGKYRDQIKEANEYYGKSSKEFDYNESSKRGKLEGKNDFSHGETYIKYHEDGTIQQFAV